MNQLFGNAPRQAQKPPMPQMQPAQPATSMPQASTGFKPSPNTGYGGPPPPPMGGGYQQMPQPMPTQDRPTGGFVPPQSRPPQTGGGYQDAQRKQFAQVMPQAPTDPQATGGWAGKRMMTQAPQARPVQPNVAPGLAERGRPGGYNPYNPGGHPPTKAQRPPQGPYNPYQRGRPPELNWQQQQMRQMPQGMRQMYNGRPMTSEQPNMNYNPLPTMRGQPVASRVNLQRNQFSG